MRAGEVDSAAVFAGGSGGPDELVEAVLRERVFRADEGVERTAERGGEVDRGAKPRLDGVGGVVGERAAVFRAGDVVTLMNVSADRRGGAELGRQQRDEHRLGGAGAVAGDEDAVGVDVGELGGVAAGGDRRRSAR